MSGSIVAEQAAEAAEQPPAAEHGLEVAEAEQPAGEALEAAQAAQAAEIPAGVLLWDQFLQFREEQRQFREDFEDHRNRVRERHNTMGEQLAIVVGQVERNTQAREDYEIEIKQLHTVMRQWYHTMLDLQRAVVLIAAHFDPDRPLHLKPPIPLRERERAA